MENVICINELQSSPTVEEFCDCLKIPYVFFHLKVDKIKNPTQEQIDKNKLYEKKGQEAIPFGWKELSYEECNKKYNNRRRKNKRHFNAMAVNLNASNKVVVDLDGHNYAEKLVEYGNYWLSRSTTRKLPHIWFEKHADDNNGTKINLEQGVDLLYSHVFEWRDTKFENCDEPMRGFNDFIVVDNKKTTKPKKKRNEPVAETPDRLFDIEKAISNEDREILENIDKKHIDDYHTWLKLIWGLYNKFECVDICDWLSQRGDSYQGYDDVKNHIENDKTQQITYGTVIHYSKESNLENYMEIRAKYIVDLKPSEESLSNAFLKLAEGDILFSDNRVFVYGSEWLYDEKRYKLKKKTRITLNGLIKRKLNQINDEDDDAPIKNRYLTEILSKVQQRKTIDNISEFSIQTLAEEEDRKKIKFDVNEEQLYNLHFRNGCYELKTKTFRKRTKMDYVSQYLDWEYNETVEQKYIDEVELFFKKLHLDEDERFFCISWLASCLDGSLHKNKFKFNIGETAENGKSTEFNIHHKVFDIYSDKIQSNFFNWDNNKRHKEIIGMMNNPIRFGYMEEMKTTKLDPDILKEMSEGHMKCEILYGTAITAKLQVTLNGCFNRMINIPLDAGIMRRALLQSYNSSFPNDYTGEDDYENKTFKPDKFFINKFDDDNMKNAYLHVLLNHYKVNIDVPKKYSNNFSDMAKEFDEFDNALDSLIEKTDNENDRIHKDDFVECMWNGGCGTKDWRVILSNMKSRKYIYNRILRCDGKKGCFVGIRFKC